MFNKKMMIILLVIFCICISISSVSANENGTDIISTEQNIDLIKTINNGSDNIIGYEEANINDDSSNNLIGQSDDDLLSKQYVVKVTGPTSIEKGEKATFTIRDSQYGIGGWSDGINISLIDYKGKSCYNFSNYQFHQAAQELKIDTSNLNAGSYTINITAANPIDSITYYSKYFQITDSKTYGTYSSDNVKKLIVTNPYEFLNTENVKMDVGLLDSDNKPIHGYVDIYIDNNYFKRMDINHDKETLNLGKLSIGKHTIKVFVRNNYCGIYEISVIKDSTSKQTAKKITTSAPTVTAYYKVNKYFKVTVKKGGKAVKT